ncbi:hypothetical protein FORC54_p002 (plasmid) [Vibrio vulnificus]|nr:hypothetical protein FORC54_p002 [Vibrio vulnificus]
MKVVNVQPEHCYWSMYEKRIYSAGIVNYGDCVRDSNGVRRAKFWPDVGESQTQKSK